jgi:oligopeptide/dipeptide ABC transporter ATP-binding protein
MMEKEVLLSVREITKWFPVDDKLIGKPTSFVKAVDGVSFDVYRGEVLGLVGESGCGKTTISRSILGLIQPTSGSIVFEGQELMGMKKKQLRRMRSDLQIVFQDPYSSLSPRMQIGDTIAEPMEIQKIGTRKERRQRVEELLEIVGLEKGFANRYPHEFSGGQRQRIGIARVLAANPKFMICDEPVSALDVSVRSQILNLLIDLKRDFGLTMLFISHDLSVVEYICDRIVVMYLGKVMEIAKRDDLYNNPSHPYTQALLSAIPVPDPTVKRERIFLEGDTPSPVNPPLGCRFCTRCAKAQDICHTIAPELKKIEEGHMVACHFV